MSIKFKKLNRFYFILLIIQLGFSQQNYHEEWYSADTEHLPQNSVKSIAPDKYGFIWMTTENGLVRFDGSNFKTFNSNTTGNISNRFLYLSGNTIADSLKTFTEGYADNIIINKRKAIKIKEKYNLTSYDEYENLRFYINNNTKQKFDLLHSKIKTQNGDYYKIEKDKILLFNKNNKKKTEITHQYKPNTDYFLLNNELIWLNNNGDYSTFDNSEKKNKIFIKKNAKIIYNHLTQQYFVYTDNEIFILKKATNKLYFSLLHQVNIPRQYTIKCLYYDIKSNKLFIGTDSKGLGIISLNKFSILNNFKKVDNNYYSIIPISNENFITAKGEIFSVNQLIADLKLNTNGYQFGIAIDKQKNIWIQNNTTLTCFFKNTNYKTSIKNEFKATIGSIFCDSKNKIWIGFRKEGNMKVFVATINANDPNSKPNYIRNIDKAVNYFAETKDHKILMASPGNLIIYDVIKQKTKKIPCDKNDIRSIFISKDNTIWVCTYSNGFSLFKNNRFYKMPIDNYSYLTSAHCINEDIDDHFWISTNKGLIEVDKKNLLAYYNDKSPVYYHHYDSNNGFLTNEFNGGCQPCSAKLENGYFIYPSLNGLVAFHPKKVNKILPTNNFYINEIELDGKTSYFNDTLFLNRNFDRVKFKIDFPYFGNHDNIYFEAKLDLNKNDKWIHLNDEKEISFTNIPPGVHTLYIRKLKPFSSTYEIEKIIINIPFLFYEKLWFKIFLAIIITSFLIIGIRLRYNFIKKKNDALEQIINERTADLISTVTNLKVAKNNLSQEVLQQKKLIGTISHDIKSPLKFLSITAKHLHEKSLITNDDNIKDNAKIMHESANQLYRFVENLVDYSKIFIEHKNLNELKKESIDSIINDKIKLFKNIAEGNAIVITYNNFAPSQINLNKKITGIIIHNLLDNAIKNTVIGAITIETNLIKNKIYISVEDTGCGMPDEIKNYYLNLQKNFETDKLAIQNYGLGLHMVLELLRLLKGDLKIYSKENEGTKVTIIIDDN